MKKRILICFGILLTIFIYSGQVTSFIEMVSSVEGLNNSQFIKAKLAPSKEGKSNAHKLKRYSIKI